MQILRRRYPSSQVVGKYLNSYGLGSCFRYTSITNLSSVGANTWALYTLTEENIVDRVIGILLERLVGKGIKLSSIPAFIRDRDIFIGYANKRRVMINEKSE